MNSQKVSIVIPTLNAEKYLELLLTSLMQVIDVSNIFIIDSSSEDRTIAIAKDYNIKKYVIKRSEFNHGKTRNLSLQICDSDFIVFMTQDALPANEYFLSSLIEPFCSDPFVAATYSRQLPRKEAQVLEQLDRTIKYPNNDIVQSQETLIELGSRAYFLSNSSAAYRKCILQGLGGFSESEIMGEDAIFAQKAIVNGYKIIYTSKSEVYHSHSYSLVDQFKRYFDTGVYRIDALGSHNVAKGKGDVSQGSSYTRQILLELMKNKNYTLIPKFLMNLTVSFLGYSLGRRYLFLPIWLCRKLSMHSYHWKKK
jgi:rhamnosyltransferase